MIEIQLFLQYLLVLIWVFTTWNILQSKKSIPLNLFGVMLISSILMICVTVSDILYDREVPWDRFAWYVGYILIAVTFNKVTNIARKVTYSIRCVSKLKRNKSQ